MIANNQKKYVFPHSDYDQEEGKGKEVVAKLKELKKMNKPKFYELSITLRAGSINILNSLLPVACNDFLLKESNQNIGSCAEDSFNFNWILHEK